MYVVLALSAFLVYALVYMKKDGKNIFKNRDKIYLTIFFAIATLILGLRSAKVGVDTQNYFRLYNDIIESSWQYIFLNLHGIEFDNLEIGYVVLAKISGIIVNDYYFFQLLIACFFCFSMMIFFKDDVNSNLILTTMFLGSGLYLDSFNISRQLIAVALTSLAWKSLCKKKLIATMVLLVLAVTFHVSSIVFVIAFLLYMIRKNKYLLYMALCLGIILSVNYNSMIIFASKYLTSYGGYISNNRQTLEMRGSILLYSIILILAIFVLVKKKFSSKERIYAILSIAFVVCVFIGLNFNYFERIGIYFLPFTILLTDTIGTKIKSKNLSRFYKIGVSICYTIYFLMSSMAAQYSYHFFWDK